MRHRRLYESIRSEFIEFYSDDDDEEEEKEKVAGGGRREEDDVSLTSLRILKELIRGCILLSKISEI